VVERLSQQILHFSLSGSGLIFEFQKCCICVFEFYIIKYYIQT
jgi:hypothetical protein